LRFVYNNESNTFYALASLPYEFKSPIIPKRSSVGGIPNPHFKYFNDVRFHITDKRAHQSIKLTMTAPQPGRSYPTVAPRPSLYSASNLLERTSTSSGFQGVYPPFQPMRSDSASKQEQTKTRRISQSRRQRTPMSCDRCKVRKIKVDSSPST